MSLSLLFSFRYTGPVYTQPYLGGPSKGGGATELFQKGYKTSDKRRQDAEAEESAEAEANDEQ